MADDYTIAPTEEFKRIKERPHNEFMPYLNRWHMMIKSVLNDYWFDTNDDYWLDDSSEVDHFMHKLYFCWQEMGIAIYGDEEE
tara:strand:- start:332 stop:580 length:249 start_codon:yes stop_codon:yes gene_type:complete